METLDTGCNLRLSDPSRSYLKKKGKAKENFKLCAVKLLVLSILSHCSSSQKVSFLNAS